jgi:hypothetical protein
MMQVTRFVVGWTTFAVLTLVPLGDVWACQCEPSGPSCQNAFQVDAVFAATARSIAPLPEDGPPLRPGELRIPRAVRVVFEDVVGFRGVSTPAVSVVTAGSGPACGYEFNVGERYLVYARQAKDGSGLVTGICSRTRPIAQAEDDLRFLQTLSTSRHTSARLYGAVDHRERDPATGEWRAVPVPNVLVAARGVQGAIDAWTDAHGRYELRLPAGSYEITAFPPPAFSARGLQRTVELRDNRGCFVADFELRLDLRVSGTVRQAAGEPAVDVVVEMMPAEDVGNTGYTRTQRARTDGSGRFEFSELPPGRYVLGVDLTRRRNEGPVFPRTFHPGTPDAALATVVQLDGAQHRELAPLMLPPARRAYRFTGTVVFEDGRPASDESVVLRDGSATGPQVGGGRTGVDGTFSIVVHEGLSYVASASYWDSPRRRQLRGSTGPFLVTGDTGPVKIVLADETYGERR